MCRIMCVAFLQTRVLCVLPTVLLLSSVMTTAAGSTKPVLLGVHAHQPSVSVSSTSRQHSSRGTSTSCLSPSSAIHTTNRRRAMVAGTVGVAANISVGASASTPPPPHSLLVVGPGVLGSYAGKLWKDAHPGASVLGLTNTSANHERLRKLGLEAATKDALSPDVKYPHVLFSAPPSGSDDYPAEVAAALARWDSSQPNSSFVFTGSMSVCAVDDGSAVTDENCPLNSLGKSPSVDKLLLSEQAVLQAGGNVVRLVGLYHANRGAHTYFLRAKEVQRPGDYLVNLLHYEDAARLSTSVLAGEGSGPFRGRAFIGCDNHPTTFRDMVTACTESGLFSGEVKWLVPDTQPGTARTGKCCSNHGTKEALGGWAPKYESFDVFMRSGGKDVYNTDEAFL